MKAGLDRLVQEKDILLLLKFHPLTRQEWTDEYREWAASQQHVIWIDDHNITKYQLMADVMISDTSSTVYEFLLLNIPVITFQTVAKDIYWIDIQQTDELPEAYEQALHDESAALKRQWIIDNYDPYLDGKVGQRMLTAAEDYISRHGVPAKRKLNLWRKYTSIKKFGKIKKH